MITLTRNNQTIALYFGDNSNQHLNQEAAEFPLTIRVLEQNSSKSLFLTAQEINTKYCQILSNLEPELFREMTFDACLFLVNRCKSDKIWCAIENSNMKLFYSPRAGLKINLGEYPLIPDIPAFSIEDVLQDLQRDANRTHDLYKNAQKKNQELEADVKNLLNKLDGMVSEVERREMEIYERFSLVLNEKKEKIRTLQHADHH
jgi:hypothetical protein